ncbi:LicA protein [Xenorhabdus mauleonii]|uniref:LicA protein n=1 Tax=Xenorhabdus mauleonii TaxID=351675 RepID=A0A1I3TVS6_9GAMM|nr:choline/ethanolamine kinase family protein [Xenorhabdus mauleonii]PHM39561.1 LicA protein [Xenorhabdus mauleonii]SFJ75378.1 Thiamine kinase [Xenorhabdus mauleonii]
MFEDIKKIIEPLIKEKVKKIERIGGMTNVNYYCETKQKKVVLRIPGNNTGKIINRVNEKYNCQLATLIDINPKLYYYSLDSGIKITKYLENSETLSPQTLSRDENLLNIAKILSKLHLSDIIFKNTFNVFEEYNRYIKQLNNIEISYPNFKETEDYFFSLQKKLARIGINTSPCHNDPVPENFIKTHEKYYLIDWEYSGMNDPMWDIAAIFEESGIGKLKQEIFLSEYFVEREYNKSKIDEKILIFRICQNFLWSIWTLLKEKDEKLFGNYGIKRYQNCLRQIKEHKKTYNACK